MALSNSEGTPVKEEIKRVTFRDVLRNVSFRNLWLGQIVSQMGDYFAFLATLVVVSAFSSDPQQITLMMAGMMIAQALPRLLFGMLAGVFVDRWDRRRTMIASDLVRIVMALAFIPAFLAHSLPAMYALGFVMSAVGTLFNPAKGALIPQLVPKELLTSANSLSQTSMMLATFIGPAIAGATFKLVGAGNEWVAFVVDSLSFALSATAIYLIKTPRYVPPKLEESDLAQSPVRRVASELKVGLRSLFLNRTMATIAIIFAVTMFGVGAINALWVTFLKVHYGFASSDLAWRISVGDIAMSAGMVIASVVVGNRLSHVTPKWFIVVGLVGAGVATLGIGYVPGYWLVVASLMVIGLFVGPINTGTSTLMQIVVPNEQMGRVGAGIGTVVDTAMLGSMSLAGLFGAAIGIPLVFFFGGVLCMAAGALAWVALPALTLKDKPAEEQTDAAEEGREPIELVPVLQAEEEERLVRVG